MTATLIVLAAWLAAWSYLFVGACIMESEKDDRPIFIGLIATWPLVILAVAIIGPFCILADIIQGEKRRGPKHARRAS
jgi:hypothetical protein